MVLSGICRRTGQPFWVADKYTAWLSGNGPGLGLWFCVPNRLRSVEPKEKSGPWFNIGMDTNLTTHRLNEFSGNGQT